MYYKDDSISQDIRFTDCILDFVYVGPTYLYMVGNIKMG